VKNLSHSASFHCLENNAPSNPGIKHLERLQRVRRAVAQPHGRSPDHELAAHRAGRTARPVSAILAGAPTVPFTTYGIAAQRDGVVIGLSANTAVADAASLYLRYEGNISGQDSTHALTAGVRMTW